LRLISWKASHKDFKPAIKPLVGAFKPHTLDLAIEQARFKEEHVQALKIPPDRNFRPNLNNPNSEPLLPTPTYGFQIPQNFQPRAPQNNLTLSKFPNQNFSKRTRFIPAAERAGKMAKGLCFLCDQPYERGHKCNSTGKKSFLVEVLADKEESRGIETFDGELEFNEEELIP